MELRFPRLGSLKKVDETELTQTLRDATTAEKKKNSVGLLETLRELTMFNIDGSTLESLISLFGMVEDEKALRMIHYFLTTALPQLPIQERERLLSSALSLCEKELESKDVSRFVAALQTLASIAPEDVARTTLLPRAREVLCRTAPLVAAENKRIEEQLARIKARATSVVGRVGRRLSVNVSRLTSADSEAVNRVPRLFAALSALWRWKEQSAPETEAEAKSLALSLEAPDSVCIMIAAKIAREALKTCPPAKDNLLLILVDAIKLEVTPLKVCLGKVDVEGDTSWENAKVALIELLGQIAVRFRTKAKECLSLLITLFDDPSPRISLTAILAALWEETNFRLLAQIPDERDSGLRIAAKKASSLLLGKGIPVTHMALRTAKSLARNGALFFRFSEKKESSHEDSEVDAEEEGFEIDDLNECMIPLISPIRTLTSSNNFSVRNQARMAVIWLLTKVEKDVAPYLREAIVDREYDSNAMEFLLDELRARLEAEKKAPVALFSAKRLKSLPQLPIEALVRLWRSALATPSAKEEVVRGLCLTLDLPFPREEVERAALASVRRSIYLLFGHLLTTEESDVDTEDMFVSGELGLPSPVNRPTAKKTSIKPSVEPLSRVVFDAIVARLQRAASFGEEGVRRAAVVSLGELVKDSRCPDAKRRLAMLEFLVELKRQTSLPETASLSSLVDAALMGAGLA